jgi:hypothetical protein
MIAFISGIPEPSTSLLTNILKFKWGKAGEEKLRHCH